MIKRMENHNKNGEKCGKSRKQIKVKYQASISNVHTAFEFTLVKENRDKIYTPEYPPSYH